MGIRLNQVVPWGRSRREYELMFSLSSADLSRGVLDCGGGPASFTAEMADAGYRVVSLDPLYDFAGSEIRARFETIAPELMDQVRATPDHWTWEYHRNPDNLLETRRTALERFLSDYELGLKRGRYVVGELPTLPFSDGSFGLALSSHLLFLYSDLLAMAFHLASVAELCRVALEVRIFPVVTLAGKRSAHLSAVQRAVQAAGLRSELVKVPYELQRGANQMLRIHRA
jgi:hypothetical protein